MCVEAGLVWAKELYFDATKVEANASLDSMRSRSLVEHGLEEHLAGIFPEQEQPQEEVANTLQTTAVGPSSQEEGQALSEANALRQSWIAGAGGQQRLLRFALMFLIGTVLGMGALVIALAGFGYRLTRIIDHPSWTELLAALAILAVPLTTAVLINRALRRRADAR